MMVTLIRSAGAGLLLFCVLLGCLMGQNPTPIPVTGVAVPASALQKTAPAGKAEAKPVDSKAIPTTDAKKTEEKAEEKPNPKLEKFKQLTFDRRPSNILKVWNESQYPPRPPAEEEDPDKGAKKADKDGKKSEVKKDPIDEEIRVFRQDVILGRWDKAKAFIKGFPPEEAETAYNHFLTALVQAAGPVPLGMRNLEDDPDGSQARMMQMMMQQRQQGLPPEYLEKGTFSVDDLLAIAAANPGKVKEKHLRSLGSLLANILGTGRGVLENTLKRFEAELKLPAGQSPLDRRQFAKLLVYADQAESAQLFLPGLEEAQKAKDAEGLNLLTRHFLALNRTSKKVQDLENAWAALQASLTIGDAKAEIHDEAIRRAVELAPRIRAILGQAWLEDSFTKHIDRGREILSALGARTSQGIQNSPQQSAGRLGELKLQKLAVEALLRAAPERAKQWREPLTLLATAWLKEADFSRQFDRSASLGPRMSFDQFGNVFYVNDDEDMPMMRFQPQMPFQAIRVGDLFEAMPSDAWVNAVEPDLLPRFLQTQAQLYLKVKEEEKSFPFIEKLAKTHPDKAKELVKEFLRVWTRNHNLNQERQTRNPFIYYYGFERRAEGIPLTRSKQERNLEELAVWVERLRKLPLGEDYQELVAKAFTSSHSNAEVYRLERIESVLGPLKTIKPRTLSTLVEQMRSNLGGLWRNPAVQEKAKTNRKQKDIQLEVQRGYQLALAVTDEALKSHPGEWSLNLAKAALLHDELNYQSEIAKTNEYSARIRQSMALFQKAAELYSKVATTLPEDQQSLLPFEQWFYASLGAVDTNQIDEDRLVDARQPALIKKTIDSLPGELSKKHMDRFANGLFTKMTGVKPAAKFRYLKFGLEIVGENKAAWEAKKLYDYYKDLLTEIKLESVVDGSTRVGHGQPFGIFVNLKHTREIERESGGFVKYLQNQNSGIGYYYNYGRPTADYRDRFQEMVKDALKDQFELLSVTFQDEKVNSRATPEFGWRFTPYAYVLLKPKGPQIDRIPSLRIDMDFLDTSGYVVLPVTSPPLPIEAKPEKGDPRPRGKTVVTQILDERQADKGKLILEVKATGVGLVGDLEDLVDLKPGSFETTQVIPQAVSVVRFDPEADNAVNTERSWMIHFAALAGTNPKEFSFGQPKASNLEMLYQRYNDADLVEAQPTISLEATYLKRNWYQIGAYSALGVFLIGLAGLGLFRLARSDSKTQTTGLPIPDKLDVFVLLGILEQVHQQGKLSDSQRKELEQTIKGLERDHFAPEKLTGVETNLRAIAEKWVKLV